MNKPNAYIGVDPGASGYACLIVPTLNIQSFIALKERPHTLVEWFTHIARDYHLAPICLEEVHSLHKMSAKSNFTFGYNVGMIQTVLKITQHSWDLVQPKLWQKETGVKFPPKTTPADKKKITAEVVDRLYPSANIRGPKGGLLDGKSDALMIAHYARLKYGKQ